MISVLLFTTAIAIRNPIRIHQNMNLFFFNRIVIFLAKEKTTWIDFYRKTRDPVLRSKSDRD
jgi:hypothetical protein